MKAALLLLLLDPHPQTQGSHGGVFQGILVDQDDVARAVRGLESDDVAERDRSARALERLGPAGLPRLEEERDAATDLEVKGRLAQIVRSIRKREEFAKVFGETRRVTFDAKAVPAGRAAADLGRALGEKIALEGVDAGRPLDLSLRDATWWEALDSLARAAGAHYEVEQGRVVFRPGRTDPLPVHYAQQFRVALTEAQRLDYRAPGASEAVLLFTLELAYQRNMKPVTDGSRDRFSIDSVTDAGGNPVLMEQPGWSNSMSFSGLAYGVVHSFFARSDAKGPLTVAGSTAVPFAYETKEVRLALEGGGNSAREEEVRLSVSAFTQSASSTSVSVRGQAFDGLEVRSRLAAGEASILDSEGCRHPIRSRGGGGSAGSWVWNFETSGRVDKPRAILLPWITKFHWVEIPFRFEGVQLPPP